MSALPRIRLDTRARGLGNVLMIGVFRLLLALVLASAGVAKLLDRPGSRRAMEAFGVPNRFVGTVAIGLPALEIALAIGLVLAASARAAAIGSATLLGCFLVAMAWNLRRGRRPDCNCFGAVHTAPIGWPSLARNLALLIAAALVVTHSGSAITPKQIVAAAVSAAVVAQSALWVLVLRRYGQALRRIKELEGSPEEPSPTLGSVAPAFSLPALDGLDVASNRLFVSEKPVLLVFTDTGCSACTSLLPRLVRWQEDFGDRLSFLIIGHGDESRLRAAAEEHGLSDVLVAPDRSVSLAYGSYGTPSALLVDRGRIATPVLYGVDEISSLLEPAAELTEELLVHV